MTDDLRSFIEIDRSTESHARCKRTIDRYASSIIYGHYRKLFGDDLPCSVVYITKSERRAKGLQKLMDDRFSKLPYEGLAMITREATEWLRAKTSNLPEREPPCQLAWPQRIAGACCPSARRGGWPAPTGN